ncbi:30S ribosomal protein S12 methylthiotransferase RimO [Eubacteriales bacterium KG127]
MKINIQTLGCMKNLNDSQEAAALLEFNNYKIVNDPRDADLIMVNTCGFIDDAKRESIDRILSMANLKSTDNEKKLIVTGCLSQRYVEELTEEMPEVDCFVGVNEYENLPDIVERVLKGERVYLARKYDQGPLKTSDRKLPENPYIMHLKIAEGCNNGCAYCIIPQIRGPFRSKSMEDVVNEAKKLSKAGCKELVLIAQDLTYYGKDLYGDFVLPKLLKKLCKVEGIQWIRLMYCYQERITDELIDVMAEEDKICPYIDIPLQHGADTVLKAMRRKTTREEIEKTIGKLRDRVKDIHIRTTLIVGFPGETDADFEELHSFVDKNRFDRLGVFKYSQEEGTIAARMENQIDEEVKEERQDAIMRLQMEISLEENQKKVGMVLPVIVDEIDDAINNIYIGRTKYDAPDIDNSVIFKCKSNRKYKQGDIMNVKITDAFDYDLIGEEV